MRSYFLNNYKFILIFFSSFLDVKLNQSLHTSENYSGTKLQYQTTHGVDSVRNNTEIVVLLLRINMIVLPPQLRTVACCYEYSSHLYTHQQRVHIQCNPEDYTLQ